MRRVMAAHQRPRQQTTQDSASLPGDTARKHQRVQLKSNAYQASDQACAQAPRRPR